MFDERVNPGHKHTVVVAEDEKSLAQMIGVYLERAGFVATLTHTGVHTLESVKTIEPDVLVLDLGLPGVDGLEVCRRVRATSDCYILILTARSSENERLLGLQAGADDYITKPFSVRELVARVRTVLRRPRTIVAHHDAVRTFGPLSIDLAGYEARLGDSPVPLTKTEFDLLVVLSSAPDHAFTRRQLIDAVWDTSWVGDDRLVDVHIGNLRRKIAGHFPDTNLIATVRGIGYRMVEQ